MPLLFELGLEGLFDTVILIKADPALCKKRSSLKDFDKRSDRFTSDEGKKADITITNNGTLAEFETSISHSMEGIIA